MTACTNTRAFFSVCIRLLSWHFLAHSFSPSSSPISPYSCPQDISTTTCPLMCLVSHRCQKSPSFPVCSGELVLPALIHLNHPDYLKHLWPFGITQTQTPSCAWIYLKISLTLISPSLFDLLPLLPALFTFTVSEMNTPIPISSRILLSCPSLSDFFKHHGNCSLA